NPMTKNHEYRNSPEYSAMVDWLNAPFTNDELPAKDHAIGEPRSGAFDDVNEEFLLMLWRAALASVSSPASEPKPLTDEQRTMDARWDASNPDLAEIRDVMQSGGVEPGWKRQVPELALTDEQHILLMRCVSRLRDDGNPTLAKDLTALASTLLRESGKA